MREVSTTQAPMTRRKEQENVWTMQGDKLCHTCGGKGHFARECPSKGKGKGQEGGWSKGGSKGGYKGKGGSKGGKDQERRVANMARAAARVQLAAVGHVEEPGQSHAHANWENGFLKNGSPHP